jgi:hypothetical protein
MVSAAGFDPATSCARGKCSTKLSYALLIWRGYGVSIPGLPVDNRTLCL